MSPTVDHCRSNAFRHDNEGGSLSFDCGVRRAEKPGPPRSVQVSNNNESRVEHRRRYSTQSRRRRETRLWLQLRLPAEPSPATLCCSQVLIIVARRCVVTRM